VKTDTTQKTARPFLKWVGGKAKLMPQFLPLIPNRYHDYYEPFLGGGAFYFKLPIVKNAYLNDVNKYLITAYIHIRDNIEEVIINLRELHKTHHSLSEEEQKEYYLARRAEYNSIHDRNIRKNLTIDISKQDELQWYV